MKNDFIEAMKQVFENPEQMDTDQIRKLIAETNSYFASLEEVFESDDEKAKEEAIKSALDLKELLESKIHLFSPFFGKQPSTKEKAMIADLNEGVQVIPNTIKP